MEIYNNIFYILLTFLPYLLFVAIGIVGMVFSSRLSRHHGKAKNLCLNGSLLLLCSFSLELLFYVLNRGHFRILQFLDRFIYSPYGYPIFFTLTTLAAVCGIGMIIASTLADRNQREVIASPINSDK